MCDGTRAQAEAIKEELTVFLHDELYLTLSPEKTAITHINDGFKFLGFKVRRSGSSTGIRTRLLIPSTAVKNHLDKIRAVTDPGTHNDSVVAKIQALNRIIGGWCRYYQYAANVARAFGKVSYKTYWMMAHWLGRKFKMKAWKAWMRHEQDGFLTAGKNCLELHQEYKRQASVRTFRKPNPYTTQELIHREELRDDYFWTGYEKRPGHADLRLLALTRDGYCCKFCGEPVTEETAQADHIKPVAWFKRPVDANYLDNYMTLCIDCHERKTRLDRRLESRMR
jgi:5-methylcytosine-specific restriction endonuclease McrA